MLGRVESDWEVIHGPSRRRERNAIVRGIHDVLSVYRLDFHRAPFVVTDEVWGILTDIDEVQAMLAGTKTWRDSIPGRELRGDAHLPSAVVLRKNVLDFAVEGPRYNEGERQRRHISPALDRDDGLPRDPQSARQIRLSPTAL